ncbi:MAG: hypothetical protein RSC08_02320 [Oscillospiraceae bacterium]
MEKESIQVQLTTDLTKYAKNLVAGTVGVTVAPQGMWSRQSDRFVTVAFPGIATLDVLWKSLKIIDEEFLEAQKARQIIFEESLKTAHDVVLHLGPRGGFHGLDYCYTDAQSGHAMNVSNGFKEEAQRIIELLKSYQIPIAEKIDP